MELSIIIPCLNAGQAIATQLEALCQQDWSKPWEVIISDNGSTDVSMEIARSYKNRLPHVRIVDSSSRRRQSHALNVGARAAAGRSLVFCDADDEVAAGWVSAMGDALQEYDVVTGQMCFDKFNSPEQAEYYSPLWIGGLYKAQFLPSAGGANIGVKRSVHDTIGGFDENLPRFADGDYSWRLQLAGYEIHYEPRAIYQYRIARVNRSLPYLFRRGWTAPAANYWTYKKYRSIGATKEMILPRRRTMRRSLVGWGRLLRDMPGSFLRFDRGTRRRWTENFTMSTGEVVGHFLGMFRNPCTPIPPETVHIKLPFDKDRTLR